MSAVLDLKQLELTKSEVIYGVSWEIYESLVKKYWGEQCPRLTYDSGILRVDMSNSDKHEEATATLELLFSLIAMSLKIDFRQFRSMTFKKKSIRKGFEPDACFYIHSLEKIEQETNIGIENKFPPDLTIEVNRTSSSVARMPIFAAFGVKELWRFDGENVKFYALDKGVYIEIETSLALPILSNAQATDFLRQRKKINSTIWMNKVLSWAENESEKNIGESIDE
jgi:Uma2 family endonuclease